MRGGAGPDIVRGITLRDGVMWLLYRSLARGDFHHDFGERTKTRDLIVKEDEKRFIDIAKNVSTKGVVALRAAFTNGLIGKTLYELLSGSFDTMVVPGFFSSTDPLFPPENKLLADITGMQWETFKSRAETASETNPLEVNVNVAGVTRQYTVRSSSYRAGPRVADKTSPEYAVYKQNRNISTMFQEVTGKSKFALIVDATGGLALTDVLNAALVPTPSSPCQFYIIQNIENASDSADKVQNIPSKAGPNQASLFYLRDIGDTVVYPLWGPAPPGGEIDQKSNIFASMQISLTRMKDGTVEADITAGPNTFHIGDVANASNVKNATLAAAAVMVEKGIVPEVFVYTLIKRMGDWCQALSLLDLDRTYTITNKDGAVGTTTLRDMLVDTEIGVVTNDRILLAFCLLHGLNVFFTSAMDLARLIYFKNANDLPDGPRLTDRTVQLYTDYSTTRVATEAATNELATRLLAQVKSAAADTAGTTELPAYLAKVKAFTVIVSRLDLNAITPFNDQSDNADLVANQAIYDNPAGEPRDKFAAVTKMIAILAKMNTRLTVGQQALERLVSGDYPGKSVIDVRVKALETKMGQGKAINSVPIVEARDTLVRVREDVEMIMKNIPSLESDLIAIFNAANIRFPEGRVADNYKEVLKGLDPTRLILRMPPTGLVLSGGGQRGGASNVAVAYAALRTRMIRVLPPGHQEQTSTTNTYAQGDDYVDDKLRPYTVVDEYIVTKEDATTFDVFFADDGSQPIDPAQVDYMCKRYMLLQFDMLRQKYEQFNDTFSRSETRVGEDDAGLVAVDIDDTVTARAGTQYADDLATISNTLQSIGSVLTAFTPANVKAYYDGGRVPSSLADIPTALAESRRLLFAMFPAAILTLPADNQQRLFGLSEYYANIILSTAAARLARTENAVAKIDNGAQVLTKQGVLLQTAIQDAVAYQDEAVPIDPAVVNTRVATALTTWLTERGIPPGPLVAEIGLRLDTAQRPRGGRRKTHRRRGLPKLV